MFIILIFQFFVGLTNFIGCIIRLVLESNRYFDFYKKKLYIYLTSVLIYLIGFVIFSIEFNASIYKLGNQNIMFDIYFLIIPWLLAIYYWSIIYE